MVLKRLLPYVSFEIDKEIKNLRSSIIISNHISYLDPILLISLFRNHLTIVKGIFFKIPLMGYAMKAAGYIPDRFSGAEGINFSNRLNGFINFIDSGGNFFIFPEGKRSRNGKLGIFKKGAFSLACMMNKPIQVIHISNTDKLFPPGSFLLNATNEIIISVKKVGYIDIEHKGRKLSAFEMREKTYELIKEYELQLFR